MASLLDLPVPLVLYDVNTHYSVVEWAIAERHMKPDVKQAYVSHITAILRPFGLQLVCLVSASIRLFMALFVLFGTVCWPIRKAVDSSALVWRWCLCIALLTTYKALRKALLPSFLRA